MEFIQIANRKKIVIISFFLFFYIILNLLDGERGLISYYEKQNINKQLLEEKNFLTKQLNIVEKKNELLTEKIDLDYLEILFREKFMFGKPNEKIYKSN